MRKHKDIIITNHAKERYVLRFKDICDERKIRRYIDKHEDIIERDLRKMYKYSNFIYHGKTDDKYEERSFFINNDILLVMLNNILITVYRVEYELDNGVSIVNNLIETIQRNNELCKYQKKVIYNSKKRINRYKKAFKRSENELEQLKALMGFQIACADNMDFNNDLDQLIENNRMYAKQLINYDNRKVIVN